MQIEGKLQAVTKSQSYHIPNVTIQNSHWILWHMPPFKEVGVFVQIRLYLHFVLFKFNRGSTRATWCRPTVFHRNVTCPKISWPPLPWDYWSSHSETMFVGLLPWTQYMYIHFLICHDPVTSYYIRISEHQHILFPYPFNVLGPVFRDLRLARSLSSRISGHALSGPNSP